MLALAALIKCAQLPLHGWLIQVVEAPTPVSAALHGGVINLGGYLLLLFYPLLSASTPAQALILIVAGVSSVLAALVMMTRISIKVKELKSYLDTLTNPWLRLDIKESRKTTEEGDPVWYCEVDTWEPPKSQTADKDGLPF